MVHDAPHRSERERAREREREREREMSAHGYVGAWYVTLVPGVPGASRANNFANVWDTSEHGRSTPSHVQSGGAWVRCVGLGNNASLLIGVDSFPMPTVHLSVYAAKLFEHIIRNLRLVGGRVCM